MDSLKTKSKNDLESARSTIYDYGTAKKDEKLHFT